MKQKNWIFFKKSFHKIIIYLSKACVLKQALGSLLLLEKVLKSDGVENTLLGGLQDLAGHEVLVQGEVRLLVVVDDVQLAHAAEVLVQELNIVVDNLQSQQLVVPLLDGAAEVEAGVALVHELEAAHLDEGAGLGAAPQHRRHHLPQQLLLGLLRMCLKPLLQPWLGLLAEECDELDHGCYHCQYVAVYPH